MTVPFRSGLVARPSALAAIATLLLATQLAGPAADASVPAKVAVVREPDSPMGSAVIDSLVADPDDTVRFEARERPAAGSRIELARSNGHLRIAITDDGRGLGALVPASVSSGGLANIRDRVAALRGTVSVTAARPSGTTVLVDLPVDGLDRAADRVDRGEAGDVG